jgi:hypothetical protein
MQSTKENSLDLIEACFDHIYKARKAQLNSRSSRYAAKLQNKVGRVSSSPTKVKSYNLYSEEPDNAENLTPEALIQELSSKYSSTVVSTSSALSAPTASSSPILISTESKVLAPSTTKDPPRSFQTQYKKFLEVKQKVDDHPDNKLEMEYEALQSDIQSVIMSIKSAKSK